MLPILLLMLTVVPAQAADELATALRETSADHSKAERLAALDKLVEIGKQDATRSAKVLTPACRDDDAEIRAKAVVALAMSMVGGECPLAIVEALSDEDENVRSQASMVLGLFEELPEAARPMVFAAAKSKDRMVRQSIPAALAALGKSEDVVAALEALFADADPYIANNAHVYHHQVTGDLHVYVGHLLRRTVATSPEVIRNETPEEKEMREFSAYGGAMVLHILTRERPLDLAKQLVEHLSHDQPAIRQCALRQLRALCTVSKQSHRAVKKIKPQEQLETIAARDPNESVRDWAGIVLNVLEEGPPVDAPETLEPLPTVELPALEESPK